MSGVSNGRAVTWPAERFYWAVLDDTTALGTGAAGGRDERLGYLFEAYLPGLAIEEVHAVYQRLPGSTSGRAGSRAVVACGLPRAVLDREVPEAAVSLCPETLPAFIDVRLDAQRLNLLRGRYLPRPLLRLQRRWWLTMALLALACVVLLSIGLERRARALDREAGALADQKLAVLRRVLPAGAGNDASPLPPEQRLLVERRRLEQTRLAPGSAERPFNAALALADLLRQWPADVPAETESLAVEAGGITIVTRVPDMTDAQRLGDALARLSGWRLQPFQSQRREDHVDVTMRLEPDNPGPGAEEAP